MLILHQSTSSGNLRIRANPLAQFVELVFRMRSIQWLDSLRHDFYYINGQNSALLCNRRIVTCVHPNQYLYCHLFDRRITRFSPKQAKNVYTSPRDLHLYKSLMEAKVAAAILTSSPTRSWSQDVFPNRHHHTCGSERILKIS